MGDCVVWIKETEAENLYIPKGVVGIVLSWVISPVLSGIFAVILFWSVRALILHKKGDQSFNRAIFLYPVLIWLAVWINAFFVISKGISKKICTKGESNFICFDNGKVNGWVAMGLSCAIGVFTALVAFPIYPWIRKTVNAEFAAKAEAEVTNKDEINVEKQNDDDQDGLPEVISKDQSTYGKHVGQAIWVALGTSLNVDPHASIEEDPTVAAIHANAEKFEPKTERVFRYIQIFTAICDSFAHGANDVANAMGPFMAIYSIYKVGGVSKKVNMGDDAYWILAIGGVGIGVGLLLYGYKIMRAIGVKLAVITPSRGFAIELGAAIVIIIGSYLGLPLSTTHCQVGATTGVAPLEGGCKGTNKMVLLKTVVGWIITLI